jgi:hypothetical protein
MASSQAVIGLNGFRAVVRPGTFTAHIMELPDPGDLDQLRVAAGNGWALWWSEGARELSELCRPAPARRPGRAGR